MRTRLAAVLRIVAFAALLNELSAQELADVSGVLLPSLDDPAAIAPSVTNGPIIEIMALDADGKNLRTVASVPNYPIINSPEVSPDGE